MAGDKNSDQNDWFGLKIQIILSNKKNVWSKFFSGPSYMTRKNYLDHTTEWYKTSM
jgi:hypothetical protein